MSCSPDALNRQPEPVSSQRTAPIRSEQMAETVARPLWHRVRTVFWSVQGCGLVLIAFTSFFPARFHLQEYFFLALLVLAAGFAWVEKKMPAIGTPLDLPVILFTAWVLLTVPFATDPAYSFAEWRKWGANVLVFYWAIVVLRNWRGKHATRAPLWAIVAGSTTVAAYALIAFVEMGGTWKDRVVRAAAPSSDYNWLTTYMVIAIPLLILTIATSRERVKRLLLMVGVGLAFFTQFFSYTRAGWLGLVAEGVAFGLCTGRRRVVLWIVGGTLAAGLGFALVSQLGYQRETVDPWTFHARVAVWQLGLQEVAAHPIVGIGYGNDSFVKLHPAYSAEAQRERGPQNLVLPAMHSTFMMVAVGSGVPALGLFVWVFVRIVQVLARQWRQDEDAQERGLGIAITVVIAGFAMRNLFDFMFAGSLAHLFWILVAMGLWSARTESSPQQGSEA